MAEEREFNGGAGPDRRGGRGGPGGPGGRGRFQRRRICAFCVDKVEQDRLQGRQHAAPLRLGSGADRFAAPDRHLSRATSAG